MKSAVEVITELAAKLKQQEREILRLNRMVEYLKGRLKREDKLS